MNTKLTLKPLLILLTLFSSFFTLITLKPTTKVLAADNNAANFTVIPMVPKSPAGFFELEYTPGNDIDLSYAISNRNSKENQKFKVSIIHATTTSDGKVSYTPNVNNTKDPLLLPQLADIKEKTVNLSPLENRVMPLKIHIPKNARGTIAGAIHILRVDPDEKSSGAISFKNRFAMSIPVLLHEKDGAKIYPDLKITKIILTPEDKPTGVQTVINNPDPVLFGHISIKAKILNEDKSKTIKTKNVKDYEWAPKSDLSFPQTIEKLEPGKYWSDLTITSGSKTYHLAKEFTIPAPKISKIVGIPEKSNLSLILGLIALFIVGLILIYLVVRKQKNSEN